MGSTEGGRSWRFTSRTSTWRIIEYGDVFSLFRDDEDLGIFGTAEDAADLASYLEGSPPEFFMETASFEPSVSTDLTKWTLEM